MENYILETKSCCITQEDMDTLENGVYLGDLIMAFYYEVLENKINDNNIALISPASSMCMILYKDINDIKECIFDPLDLKNKKYIFAPVNDNKKIEYSTVGSHWVLNLIDVPNKIVYFLDSMKGDVENAHTLHQNIEKLFGAKFKFIFALNKQYQFNSYDCGIFVLGFTESILMYLKDNNNELLKDKNNLDYIFKDKYKKKIEMSYLPQFRKDIKNLIYTMAKNK